MKFYKIILVDDDPLLIEDLKKNIDWNSIGFQIVGTALNGKTALKICRDLRPDIVMTDIVMPQLNGIEFIRALRRINSNVCILVLSSFGEFEYAKAAIEEGVSEYILKLEMTPRALTDKLNDLYMKLSVGDKLDLKAARLELQDYFSNENQKNFEWLFLKSPEKKQLYFVVLITKELLYHTYTDLPTDEQMDLFLNKISRSFSIIEDNCVIFRQKTYAIIGIDASTSRYNSSAEYIYTLIRRCVHSLEESEHQSVHFVFFAESCSLTRFHRKYFANKKMLDWHLFFADNAFRADESFGSEKTGTCNLLKNWGELSGMNSSLRTQYVENFVNDAFERHDISAITSSFFSLCTEAELPYDIDLFFKKMNSASVFSDFIQKTLDNWILKQHALPASNYSSLIRHAVNYIENHYYDASLSIEMVATSVGLSTGRLSVLFKKGTGKTINEWITERRIKEAISLLLNSNYKIYEISDKVGYHSSQYFSQIFFQRTGKKPVDFRNKASVTYKLGDINS